MLLWQRSERIHANQCAVSAVRPVGAHFWCTTRCIVQWSKVKLPACAGQINMSHTHTHTHALRRQQQQRRQPARARSRFSIAINNPSCADRARARTRGVETKCSLQRYAPHFIWSIRQYEININQRKTAYTHQVHHATPRHATQIIRASGSGSK